MKEKTEKEKMLARELYLATDEELTEMHLQARRLLHVFNFSAPDREKQQKELILSLFGSIGSNFTVRPLFYCDYGCHISAGDRLYINYNCTILDCNKVHLGNDVLLAPGVQIYTGYHPTDPNTSRLTIWNQKMWTWGLGDLGTWGLPATCSRFSPSPALPVSRAP